MADLEAERKLLKIVRPVEDQAKFADAIIGQDEAVEAFATLLVKIQSGIRPIQPGPIDIKFLAGPSGVGKTEIVYRLAEILVETDPSNNQNPRLQVLKINAGEYQSRGEISRLLGSPPGYIGSEDSRWPGGTEPLFSQRNLDRHRITYTDKRGKQRNIVIILVDEAEKAHPSLHQAFLSVLDKGHMQLSNNTATNFNDAVIFYTSNAGNAQVERLREEASNSGKDVGEAFREAIGEALLRDDARDAIAKAFRDGFPPEFRGRIRELIIFQQLKKEDLAKIVGLKLKAIESEFRANGVNIGLQISEKTIEWLVARGYNTSEGARALEKVLESFIRNPLLLAHTSANLHQRVIAIDMEVYGLEPEFYLVEGKQPPPILNQPVIETVQAADAAVSLPQTTPKAQTTAAGAVREYSKVPQIPDRIKLELFTIIHDSGVAYYVNKRDQFVRQGVLEAKSANMQPEIILVAAARALEKMVVSGVSYYVNERDQIARAGIISVEALNNAEAIKQAARQRLVNKLKLSMDAFINERDQLVRAGIGTLQEWNAILNQVS